MSAKTMRRILMMCVTLLAGVLAHAQAKGSASAKASPKPKVASPPPSLEPKTFRGHAWGDSKADAGFGEGGIGHCSTMDMFRPPEEWCGEDFEMGEITATVDYRFVDDRLVAVDVSYYPSEYDYVRTAFIERYGRPTATIKVPMKTGGGLAVTDEVTTWNFPKVRIEMHKFGTTISRGTAYIVTKAWEAESKRREKASAKKAKDAF